MRMEKDSADSKKRTSEFMSVIARLFFDQGLNIKNGLTDSIERLPMTNRAGLPYRIETGEGVADLLLLIIDEGETE